MAYVSIPPREWARGEPFGAPVEHVDALLMDVARRIQLSPTKHAQAEQHYRALCEHVDREGSPLEGKVVECYPSGSFATGTAVASQVSRDQHDVDVVIELDINPRTPPSMVLGLLYAAINGEPGSRYHDKVQRNSRCITVTYDDNTTIDLMPIARLAGEPDRAGHLFHFKPEADETYHKPVNPWAFARHFNEHVEVMEEFAKSFEGRRRLADGSLVVEKADTQPMPDHVPLAEKSPRVVTLQLLKRWRDVSYRGRTGRKPPSIVMAALSLDAGLVKLRLVDELIAVANYIGERISAASIDRRRLEVRNPAYRADLFTDRWPADVAAQDLFARDLRQLRQALHHLRNEVLGFDEIQKILERLFGETAARYAIKSHLDAHRHEAEAGRMRMGPRGRVFTGAAGATAPILSSPSVRASTFTGGAELS